MAATDKMAMTREQMEALGGVITGNVGKARILTSADYNWPTDNSTSVALWLLPAGIYTKIDSSVWVRSSTSANLGVGTFIVMPHSGSGVVAILTVQEGTPKQVDVSYTRTSNGTYLAGGGNVLLNSSVVNDLTSTDSGKPLSAAQGKVLKDMIDALPTGGGITELTSADYNWPTSNPTSVALWLLEPGLYTMLDSSVVVKESAQSTVTQTGEVFLVSRSAGGTVQIYKFNFQNALIETNLDSSGNVNATTMYLTASNISQATGTSTSNVMSQNAVTSMVFADPATKNKVQIGDNAQAVGVNAVSIGSGSTAGYNRSSALGAYSTAGAIGATAVGYGSIASAQGEVGFGLSSTYTGAGYNNSDYRLLTGLYDGQSAHDAATYGQLNTRLDGLTLLKISQTDYDNLSTYDANTLYVITGA